MSDPVKPKSWTYEEAFARNRGLLSEGEQARLRGACVAIAGVGGVGGGHALTLARQGVGRFRLADPDTFNVANFNRQAGARLSSLGVNKALELKQLILEINPEAEITVFEDGINEQNIDRFLEGAGVVIDGLDFFVIEARRLLHAAARRRGLWSLVAGPLGFSVAFLAFDPKGVSFDDFCDLRPGLSRDQQLIAFVVAQAPASTHVKYMDLSHVDFSTGAAPSAGLACTLCNGITALEAISILVGRRPPAAAPRYMQFDPYRRVWKAGRLWFGNRGPLQRLKRRLLTRHLKRLGVLGKAAPAKPVAEPRVSWEPQVTRLPVPDAVMRAILEAGIKAPSADNMQPWRFSYEGSQARIYLQLDPRDRLDFRGYAALLSAGAVIENMRQAAAAHGLRLAVLDAPAAMGTDLVAAIELSLGSGGGALAGAIAKRDTNRRPYPRAPLPPALLSTLAEGLRDFPTARLSALTDRGALKRLARATALFDRVRTEGREFHETLHSMLRWTPEEVTRAQDGFPIDNLMVGAAGKLYLKTTEPWNVMHTVDKLGLWRISADVASKSVINCSGVLFLTMPSATPGDMLLGGQAMERLWLSLTQHGLAAQPLMVLPIFSMRWFGEGGQGFSPAHQALLKKGIALYQGCFPEVNLASAGQAMLMRVGYAEPIAVGTPRKPLEALLRSATDDRIAPAPPRVEGGDRPRIARPRASRETAAH